MTHTDKQMLLGAIRKICDDIIWDGQSKGQVFFDTDKMAEQILEVLQATDLPNEHKTSKRASSESETQLTLQDFKEYFEANLLDGDEIQPGQMMASTEVYEVMQEFFTQALTSLKSEMEKKKISLSEPFTTPPKGWTEEVAERKAHNHGISECQRVIDGMMK